jgi:hypothetical protein
MWVVIDVDKGEVIHLAETKKEALNEAQLQRYLDKFINYKNKYVVIKEEEI